MPELEKSYWNSRYQSGHNSGYGSYGEQLSFKLGQLKKLEGIKSITEIGCGDFNFGKRVMELFPEASYTGNDISDFIIEKNTALYPFATFTTSEDVPPADLVICVDVLLHVYDKEEADKLLDRLEKLWTKYLVVTAYERDEEMVGHVRIRTFDYKRFGEPIVREVVEHDGLLYFYIFKK